MPDLNLSETELAAGAAVAMDMAREDRKDRKHIQTSGLSSSSTAIVIAFVAISSIGMLVLMMAMAPK